MKICERCGREYEDSEQGCPYCAQEAELERSAETESVQTADSQEPASSVDRESMMAALEAAKAAGAEELNARQNEEIQHEQDKAIPKSKLKIVLPVTIITGLLLIAAVVAGIWYFTQQSGDAAKKPVEQYLSGYEKKDIDQIMESYPDYMKKLITSNSSKEELWKNLDDTFSQSLGEDWSAQYKITKTTETTAAEVSSLKQYIQSYYNYKATFKTAYWVSATLTMKGNGQSNDLALRFAVAQIDGKWSVVYEGEDTTTDTSESQKTTQAE